MRQMHQVMAAVHQQGGQLPSKDRTAPLEQIPNKDRRVGSCGGIHLYSGIIAAHTQHFNNAATVIHPPQLPVTIIVWSSGTSFGRSLKPALVTARMASPP